MRLWASRLSVVFVFAVMFLYGCKASSTSAESTVAGEEAGGEQRASAPQKASGAPRTATVPASYAQSRGTTVGVIDDPTLGNIPAVDVTYPAGWRFEGRMIPADECKMLPYVVYRATSPDGLTFTENQPTLHWKFGSGPLGSSRPAGCLPIDHPISAKQFLQYVADTMHYTWVGDEPVPAEEQQKVQSTVANTNAQYASAMRQAGAAPMRQTVDLARARVTFVNGSYTMYGQLDGHVTCTEQRIAGWRSALAGVPSRPDSVLADCGGEVRFTAAPASQYERITKMLDDDQVSYKPEPGWINAYVQRSNAITARNIKTLDDMIQAQNNASRAFWDNARQTSQIEHEQFMQGMRDQYNHFQQGQAQQQAARSQFSSDMVDYALDRQTVTDPETGQLSKVSNLYSHTWVDETGQHSFQTNNINADPNGILPGIWTKQQVVHGDGTPY